MPTDDSTSTDDDTDADRFESEINEMLESDLAQSGDPAESNSNAEETSTRQNSHHSSQSHGASPQSGQTRHRTPAGPSDTFDPSNSGPDTHGTNTRRNSANSIGGGPGQGTTSGTASNASSIDSLKQNIKSATMGAVRFGRTNLSVVIKYLVRKAKGDTDKMRGLSGAYYPEETIRREEEVVFAANPSRWRSAGPYTVALLLFAIGVLTPLFVYYGPVISHINNRTPSFFTVTPPSVSLMSLFSLLFILLGILLLFIESLRRASRWLILTDQRIYHRTHILDRNVSELQLEDINKIETREEFPIRLLGVGHLALFTASTDQAELTFRNIKHPEIHRNSVQTKRNAAETQSESGDD